MVNGASSIFRGLLSVSLVFKSQVLSPFKFSYSSSPYVPASNVLLNNYGQSHLQSRV